MNKKFFFGLAVALVILGAGVAIGWLVGKDNKDARIVSGQTIISALQERGFLVTETAVSMVSATISTDTSSIWKKLLWGQEIKASGVVEVNMGVDLAKILEEDIEISGKKIILSIEPAEIFNSRVVGNINLENKQGLLKRLLENDDGYNQAQSELLKQAEEAVFEEKMIDIANKKAKDEITRLLKYIAPEKEVVVMLKI
jgi:hypothetical protein